MTADQTEIQIVDCTLRDGAHVISQQYTLDNVRAVASALDKAGVWAIAVAHGDGLGASSQQFWKSLHTDEELITAAREVVKDSRIAAPLLPGIGTKRDLEVARAAGLEIVRVSTVCTEADIGLQHLRLARELGMEAHSHLNMAHLLGAEEMAKQAQLVAEAGAQCVYICDTAGALIPSQVKAVIAAMREALDPEIAVGIHAHDNLSLAVGNSLAAIEEGATVIDTCLAGMGAGAGNCQTEALVAVLKKLDRECGVDLWQVQDIADHYIRAEVMTEPVSVDRLTSTLGYAGVPASFLSHTVRASERFGVDAREVILEVGRLKAVSGQEEDMPLEVAARLAQQGGRSNASGHGDEDD